MRLGTVASVDVPACRIRVARGGLTTDWVPCAFLSSDAFLTPSNTPTVEARLISLTRSEYRAGEADPTSI